MKSKKFKILANNYKNLIYTQAFYFTNNHEDAEDICQEVLIRLWDNFDHLKDSVIKFWLLKTTRNLCTDYSRKKRIDTVENPDEFQGVKKRSHTAGYGLSNIGSTFLQRVTDGRCSRPILRMSAVDNTLPLED